jgi:hypothetical protein
VFWFSIQIISETFIIQGRIFQDTVISLHRSSCKVQVFLIRCYGNFSFVCRFIKKYSYTKFHENPSSGNRVVPCGQTDGRTDRHDEANSLFFFFCNFADAPKSQKLCRRILKILIGIYLNNTIHGPLFAVRKLMPRAAKRG